MPPCQRNGDLNCRAAKASKFIYFSFLVTWQMVLTISPRKPQAI
jgi:hypothetical protein